MFSTVSANVIYGEFPIIGNCVDTADNYLTDTAIYQSQYDFNESSVEICRSKVLKSDCDPFPLGTCDLPSHNDPSTWEISSDTIKITKSY